MKTIQSLLIIGIMFSMILNSCSIEKRVFRSGYHIEWHKSKNENQKQDESSANLNEQVNQKIDLVDVKLEIKTIENFEFTTSEKNKTSEEKIIETSSNSMNESENILEVESNLDSESIPAIETKNKVKAVKSESNNLHGFGEGKSGLFLLIIGLLLIGLAWVFYAYLGILGLIFSIIFGIAGVIYFIAGIIALIANS